MAVPHRAHQLSLLPTRARARRAPPRRPTYRAQQRRQRAGDAVEERSAQSSLVGFALLDGLPLSEGFGRRADRRVTEYVRVTAHHLVDELLEQIAHGELA